MKEKAKRESARRHHGMYHGGGQAVYFFGMIGSAVYYIQQSEGFWTIITALLKALVWPAFVVYDLLKFLHG